MIPHINLTNKRQINPIKVRLNNITLYLPYGNTAQYLGITLLPRLRWMEDVKIKVAELRLKYRKMYWLLGRNYHMSTHNKILLYSQILRFIGFCGMLTTNT